MDISADNGVTYFGGLGSLFNTCLYNRLELRETGDYNGHVENGRRIMAIILSAKMNGLPINLGYEDTDGPGCRVSSVSVQW